MKFSISHLFATASALAGLTLTLAAPTPEPYGPQGRALALARQHQHHHNPAARKAFAAAAAAHRRFPRDEETGNELLERSEDGEDLEQRAFGPAGYRPGGAHHFGAAAKAKAFKAAKARAFKAAHRFAPRDEESVEELAERSEGDELEERALGPAGFHPGAHHFGAAAKARAFKAAKARALRAAHRIGRRDEEGVEELAERSEDELEERAFGPAGFHQGAHHFGAAKGFKAAKLRALKAGRRFGPRDEIPEEVEARAFGPTGSHFGAAAARAKAFKQRKAFKAAKFGGARRLSRLGGRDEIPEEQT